VKGSIRISINRSGVGDPFCFRVYALPWMGLELLDTCRAVVVGQAMMTPVPLVGFRLCLSRHAPGPFIACAHIVMSSSKRPRPATQWNFRA
jgi:hypothetical protein